MPSSWTMVLPIKGIPYSGIAFCILVRMLLRLSEIADSAKGVSYDNLKVESYSQKPPGV